MMNKETSHAACHPRLLQILAVVGLSLGAGAHAASRPAHSFELTSPDLSQGVFDERFTLNGFGCKGGNISPALSWQGAPEGTKSFSIQMVDLDAPAGGRLTHWAVYNIPATVSNLAQGAGNVPGSLPAPAFGGDNDFQDTGATGGNGAYGGPCPPAGDKAHRYLITIYALGVADVQAASGVPKTATAPLYAYVFNKGIGAGLLGKASLTARYGR